MSGLLWSTIFGVMVIEAVIILSILMFKRLSFVRNSLATVLKFLFTGRAAFVIVCLAFVLLFLMFDARRETVRVEEMMHEKDHLDTQTELKSRMFRAQRNIYIAGFTLYLGIVLWNLVRYSEYSKSIEDKLSKIQKLAKDGDINQIQDLVERS